MIPQPPRPDLLPRDLPLRLVASDLDGTLVRSDGTISDRTVAALQAAEAAGLTVVFVTGRPPRWMAEVARRTGHTGLAICANGALVYDLHTERVVEEHPLSVEVARQVVRRLRAALPDLGFAVETSDGFLHEEVYRPRWPVGTSVAPLDELLANPAVKLLARHDDLDADELLAAAREVVGPLAELTHSSSEGLLEVSAAGVSKATTLAALCLERGVDAAEVVAFGDMPNDLPMLAWAGTAYAMANAHAEVLAAVGRRTKSNDEDGVAHVLEELLPADRP
ncbi:MAG: Cof-type HAD-IIB family hydrolase [Actinomycetota bacterium]|nr:Cof-type HAD-IIB family hydrolase [Actinomycetota bacterium]